MFVETVNVHVRLVNEELLGLDPRIITEYGYSSPLLELSFSFDKKERDTEDCGCAA